MWLRNGTPHCVFTIDGPRERAADLAILPPVPSYYLNPDAPSPNHPRRVGVVAFIERDGALLLERRSDFGTWGIPGGAVDEHETVEEAIAREVLEETGLATVAIDLLGVFSEPSRIIAYPDGNVFRLLSMPTLPIGRGR